MNPTPLAAASGLLTLSMLADGEIVHPRPVGRTA